MQIFKIGQYFKTAYNRIAYFPFIFALIMIEVYFWINGPAHFTDWSSTYADTILIYLGMTLVFLFWSGRRTQEQMRTPLRVAMPTFVMFFIGTYLVLFFFHLFGIFAPGSLEPELFWQTVFLQVCVVATSEELMFRGVVLELTNIPVSAAAFALWHAWAYGIRYYDLSWAGANYGAIIFAFIIGILLAYVAKQKQFGLPAVIAIHASYNLFVIGAFFTL
jgi:membrane protease YdiL (CAAX protease family)